MSLPIDNIRIDGQRLDANLSNNLKPESDIVRSMEGAPTIRLVVHDPERELLETGVLIKAHRARKALRGTSWDARLGRTRLVLGGRFYVMAGLDKRGSDLELSFEGWISSRLRHVFKPVTVRRGNLTRAEFIKYRLIKPAAPLALVWAPSLSVDQPIAEPEPERTKRGVRVNTGLTIKDEPIDRTQAREINTSLKVADRLKAPARARQALVCAGIEESGFRPIMNTAGSPYGGVFQGDVGGGVWALDDTAGMAESFLKGGKGFQGGGAIALAREHPDWPIGRIVLTVQGSISNFGGSTTAGIAFYEAHIEEAREILEAYGGSSFDDGGATTEREKRVMFRAGGKKGTPEEENYLAAIERLIRGEVNWRAFEDENGYFLAHDLDFLKNMPVAMIAEQATARERQIGVQEVGNIDFPFHIADDNSRASFQAATDEWFAFSGAVVQVIRCGPMAGKHLMWEFRQGILSPLADITLHRPTPPLKEPAPVIERVSTADVGAVPTKIGDLIYPTARHGTNLGGVAAHKARPFGNWQSDNAVDIGVPIGTRIFAVDEGTIIRLGGSYDGTGQSNPNGFNVTLKTKDNEWFYTHLKSRERLEVGDVVEPGQILGRSGAANSSPHLHIASLYGDPEVLLGV